MDTTDDKLLRGENTGIIVDVRPTDFTATGTSAVVYDAVNPSGDWSGYKPTDEWQRRYIPPSQLGYDTNSCTNFSCMNSIELQIQRMLKAGEIPADMVQKMKDLNWFDENGLVNFSDWFNAITSGTSDAYGNTLYAPWDAVRKYGVLAQSNGYKPNDFTDASGWFGTHPNQDQLDMAKESLSIIDCLYEWVSIGNLNQWDLYDTHLKQAPLHVLVPTGSTWNNNGLVTNTGPYTGVNHAITLLSQQKGVKHEILDHYNLFVKELDWTYYIPYAMKGVITLAIPSTNTSFVFSKQMDFGDTNEDVRELEKKLIALGYSIPDGPTNYFGPQTRTALQKFQCKKGIACSGLPTTTGYGRVGPKTLQALNNS